MKKYLLKTTKRNYLIMYFVLLILFIFKEDSGGVLLKNRMGQLALVLIGLSLIFAYINTRTEKANYQVLLFLTLLRMNSLVLIESILASKTIIIFVIIDIIYISLLFTEKDNKLKTSLRGLLLISYLAYSLVILVYLFNVNIDFFKKIPMNLIFYGGIIFLILNIVAYYKNQLNMARILLNQARLTNESLYNTQSEFKQIHETLSKQKLEMEEANKKATNLAAEMYIQNEIMRYISSVLNIEELLDMVTDAVIGTIGVDTCYIMVYDKTKKDYLYKLKSGKYSDKFEKLKESNRRGEYDKYYASKELILDNNADSKKYKFINDRDVKSLIIMPLIGKDETVGLLVAEHSTKDTLSYSRLQFFEGISTQITIALNNARLYELMEKTARTDGLTGLYNRRYLQEYVKTLILEKKADLVTMVLFDIDHFKSINDTYGHIFGDEAIKMVSGKMLDYMKDKDGIAARYGGEEFVFIFKGIGLEDVYEMMRDFHSSIKNQVMYFKDNTRTKEVKINISMGITSYPKYARTVEELFIQSDNSMYRAKENGRGQIITMQTSSI